MVQENIYLYRPNAVCLMMMGIYDSDYLYDLTKKIYMFGIMFSFLNKKYFQFFLSNRAVYLLLWNIRLGSEHAGLDFWLSSIACHAPKAPVFVVGSHCDKVSTVT